MKLLKKPKRQTDLSLAHLFIMLIRAAEFFRFWIEYFTQAVQILPTNLLPQLPLQDVQEQLLQLT